MRRWGTALVAIALGLAVVGCSGPPGGSSAAIDSPTPAPASDGSGGVDLAAAKQYCTEKRGKLVDRVATWNTNGDTSAQLPLAGRMTLCEFDSSTAADATRISVDLVTLYSTEPTLAAIAYLSKVPPTLPKTPSSNPAAYNCDQGLGGTSDFGNGVAGGGWVNESEPVFKVMNLCVFADLSAIDEFGIFYYATGAVRGADLAPILRYQPGSKLPAVFGS